MPQLASIIIASEPVWASMVGFICLQEKMSQMDMLGALLISTAGLGNELNWFSFADGSSLDDKENDERLFKN